MKFGRKKRIINRKKKHVLLFIMLIVMVFAGAAGIYIKKIGVKPEYIFLMSGVRGYEDFPMFSAFEKEITDLGGKPKVLDFEDSDSVITQRRMLKEAVTENTACIIVNAANSAGLEDILREAVQKGIRIISCISETESSLRQLHIGTVDPESAGEAFIEEAAEACGEKGKFAIISESPQLVLSRDIMMYIRYIFEEHRYPNMIFSDVLYGYEDEKTNLEKISRYLEETSDVKVLICLSEGMTSVCCQAVTALNMEGEVSIVGMGQSKYFTDYMENENVDLRLLSCDMEEFGTAVADIAYQLVAERITGEVGESLAIGEKSYFIQKDYGLGVDEEEGTVIYFYETYDLDK